MARIAAWILLALVAVEAVRYDAPTHKKKVEPVKATHSQEHNHVKKAAVPAKKVQKTETKVEIVKEKPEKTLSFGRAEPVTETHKKVEKKTEQGSFTKFFNNLMPWNHASVVNMNTLAGEEPTGPKKETIFTDAERKKRAEVAAKAAEEKKLAAEKAKKAQREAVIKGIADRKKKVQEELAMEEKHIALVKRNQAARAEMLKKRMAEEKKIRTEELAKEEATEKARAERFRKEVAAYNAGLDARRKIELKKQQEREARQEKIEETTEQKHEKFVHYRDEEITEEHVRETVHEQSMADAQKPHVTMEVGHFATENAEALAPIDLDAGSDKFPTDWMQPANVLKYNIDNTLNNREDSTEKETEDARVFNLHSTDDGASLRIVSTKRAAEIPFKGEGKDPLDQ